ncbi:MAG: SUMF1/EgtB/PvdO family nonheme iron enzyme [Planctomycetota bacterium]|jgi:formylglycine-generating enzyme required for sulfatase activity
MKLRTCAIVLAAVMLAAGTASALVEIEMVIVGDPGNPATLEPAPDWQMGERYVGDVDYVYEIGKTEVTSAQYTEFLNAVAATDTYTLYDTRMMNVPGTDMGCQIQRSGASGSYTYVANSPNLPVNWVDWGDAIRFVNWLENGQPTGAQDLTTTEDGTYFLNGATNAADITNAIIAGRAAGASFHLPSESEWIKAARYNPYTSTYFDYATSSNVMPTSEAPPGGSNSANYNKPLGTPNGDLFDVGSYVASVSPYGTFDQNGNVVEFCDSTYPKLYSSPGSVLLGGHLASADFATKVFRNPQNESHAYGFRVAAPGFLAGPGDFDEDGDVDADDIDILADAIEAGSSDSLFDVNVDGFVDEQDLVDHIATLVERTDGGIGTYRGDFNLDGYVDATDLAILKAGFGLTGLGYALGNANADDFVDGTDLAIFKATFGFSGTPGGGNPPAVPEPATISLLALGGLAIVRRQRIGK